jgi:O-acetyl-ADP-ribose deacetylase (regulator of RNase III)
MVKVILHFASVHADTADLRVVPFRQPDQIRRCVRGALLEMATINAASGIFSPPGSPQREEQEQRAAAGDGRLRSILFPLFGTGVGGASVPEVVELMLNALVGFLSDHTAKLVDDLDGIYLSAFSEDDVAAVDAVLTARLG